MKVSGSFGSRTGAGSVRRAGCIALHEHISWLPTSTVRRRGMPVRPAHGADEVGQSMDDHRAFGRRGTAQRNSEDQDSAQDDARGRERTEETNALDHDLLPRWQNWCCTRDTRFNDEPNTGAFKGERKVNSEDDSVPTGPFVTSPISTGSRAVTWSSRSVGAVVVPTEVGMGEDRAVAGGAFAGHADAAQIATASWSSLRPGSAVTVGVACTVALQDFGPVLGPRNHSPGGDSARRLTSSTASNDSSASPTNPTPASPPPRPASAPTKAASPPTPPARTRLRRAPAPTPTKPPTTRPAHRTRPATPPASPRTPRPDPTMTGTSHDQRTGQLRCPPAPTTRAICPLPARPTDNRRRPTDNKIESLQDGVARRSW
jgi:hypothetical protein